MWVCEEPRHPDTHDESSEFALGMPREAHASRHKPGGLCMKLRCEMGRAEMLWPSTPPCLSYGEDGIRSMCH